MGAVGAVLLDGLVSGWVDMGKRKEYDSDTKAAAMAALYEGQSVSAVAREYNIPKGTVSGWKNAKGSMKVATQKKGEEIGELLLGYLHENIITLKAQAEHFRDKKWLMGQDAGELAVLHGVMTDKAVRLLEAMSNVPDDSTP